MAAFVSGCAALEVRRSSLTRRLDRHGIQEAQVELGDETIRYWRGGVGDETVVLLHGFGADALWQWYPQLRALSSRYQVVAPDLLWFGGSSSTVENYSLEHQARAVLRLLDALDIQRTHVMGLSYGGMVADALVQLEPDRVDRIVLVSSPARAFMAQDQEPLMHRYGVSSIEELLLPQRPADVKRLLSLAYANPPFVPRFVRREILETFYTKQRDHQLRLLHRVEDDTGALLRRAQAGRHETLVLWGLDDEIFPALAAQRLTGTLGERAQLCVFDRAAHAPHLERASDFNALALAFLANGHVRCEVAAAITWRKP